jgi:hypothetical protein
MKEFAERYKWSFWGSIVTMLLVLMFRSIFLGYEVHIISAVLGWAAGFGTYAVVREAVRAVKEL